MYRQRAIAGVVALLSAGWLAPAWMSVYFYLSFWQGEGWPLLRGERPVPTSFLYLHGADECFQVACLWLGVVILFWSYLGYAAFTRRAAA